MSVFGDVVSGHKAASRGCYGCSHLRRVTESWEMPNVWWYECRKREANAFLPTFPFKNGCKHYEPTTPHPPEAR